MAAESLLNAAGLTAQFGRSRCSFWSGILIDANKRVAQAGGSVAGNARKDLEQRLGRPVITSQNASQLNHVVTQMIEASVATADEDNAGK